MFFFPPMIEFRQTLLHFCVRLINSFDCRCGQLIPAGCSHRYTNHRGCNFPSDIHRVPRYGAPLRSNVHVVENTQCALERESNSCVSKNTNLNSELTDSFLWDGMIKVFLIKFTHPLSSIKLQSQQVWKKLSKCVGKVLIPSVFELLFISFAFISSCKQRGYQCSSCADQGTSA